jgi:hypothetical protein
LVLTGSVVSLVIVTLYKGTRDSNHNLSNIVSNEKNLCTGYFVSEKRFEITVNQKTELASSHTEFTVPHKVYVQEGKGNEQINFS